MTAHSKLRRLIAIKEQRTERSATAARLASRAYEQAQSGVDGARQRLIALDQAETRREQTMLQGVPLLSGAEIADRQDHIMAENQHRLARMLEVMRATAQAETAREDKETAARLWLAQLRSHRNLRDVADRMAQKQAYNAEVYDDAETPVAPPQRPAR